MRYRLEVRLTAADVGQRVVIRWRRPGPDDGEQIGAIWARRADRYSERRTRHTSRKKVTRKVEMSHIGG